MVMDGRLQNLLLLPGLKFFWSHGFLLLDGSMMEITKVYPLDAVYDNPEDVPEEVKTNKRYTGCSTWTFQQVAESIKEDFSSISTLVHSLANGTAGGD